MTLQANIEYAVADVGNPVICMVDMLDKYKRICYSLPMEEFEKHKGSFLYVGDARSIGMESYYQSSAYRRIREGNAATPSPQPGPASR